MQCPYLLIVGGLTSIVIDLNERALAQMRPEPEKRLAVVPGASHLFEEPGTLEQAARLAREWFQTYLRKE
jgi:pimeloyl-ACP methyl ester carboxylesterase